MVGQERELKSFQISVNIHMSIWTNQILQIPLAHEISQQVLKSIRM